MITSLNMFAVWFRDDGVIVCAGGASASLVLRHILAQEAADACLVFLSLTGVGLTRRRVQIGLLGNGERREFRSPRLCRALDSLCKGDGLITRRLARSTRDLLNTLAAIAGN
jgi:hypothetical protein